MGRRSAYHQAVLLIVTETLPRACPFDCAQSKLAVVARSLGHAATNTCLAVRSLDEVARTAAFTASFVLRIYDLGLPRLLVYLDLKQQTANIRLISYPPIIAPLTGHKNAGDVASVFDLPALQVPTPGLSDLERLLRWNLDPRKIQCLPPETFRPYLSLAPTDSILLRPEE
jgi:hypothetical protein